MTSNVSGYWISLADRRRRGGVDGSRVRTQRSDQCHRNRKGVSSIYNSRDDYSRRRTKIPEEYIASTDKEFIYVGIFFTMAAEQAQSQVDEILKELLRKGCRVKIVLLDPTAPKEVYSFLETYLACGQNTLHPRVCHAVDHFTVFRDSLNREERERFDLRVHSFPLTSSAFILDREEATSDMLVDVKWFGAGRNSSLILEFRRKKDKPELLKTIEASFLRVLKLSRQV